MNEQRPPFALWQEARRAPNPDWEWRRLMIADGHFRDEILTLILIHRVLYRHAPGDVCPDCPCHHCGTDRDDPDGDHSCPCPYNDQDCRWHHNPAVPPSPDRSSNQ